MYTWAQSSLPILEDLRSVGTLLLQRLVSQYKVLLSGSHAAMQSSARMATPLKVTAIWSPIVHRIGFLIDPRLWLAQDTLLLCLPTACRATPAVLRMFLLS